MNKRNTVQRALVLDAVRTMQRHATADEVYAAIVAQHPNVSRGTVYRNLNLLSDTGEIRKVEVPGGADRYDHICDKHYHISCVRCGRIFDVDMAPMTDLEQRITDKRGFQFADHDIMFKGLCPACRP